MTWIHAGGILHAISVAGLFLAMTSGAAAPESRTASPDIRIVVMHIPGPAWRAGVSFREQAGVEKHIAYYQGLLDRGELSLGGPFLDNSGGMMISSPGVSLDEMIEFASNDPTVKSGLLTVSVRPWLVGMKASDR